MYICTNFEFIHKLHIENTNPTRYTKVTSRISLLTIRNLWLDDNESQLYNNHTTNEHVPR